MEKRTKDSNLERKIYKRLERFFNEERNSLLVTGARQTGKTFAIREMGKKCFKHFVEINFVDRPEAVSIFKEATSAVALVPFAQASKAFPVDKPPSF